MRAGSSKASRLSAPGCLSTERFCRRKSSAGRQQNRSSPLTASSGGQSGLETDQRLLEDPKQPLEVEHQLTMPFRQVQSKLRNQRIRDRELRDGKSRDRELTNAHNSDTELGNADDTTTKLSNGDNAARHNGPAIRAVLE